MAPSPRWNLPEIGEISLSDECSTTARTDVAVSSQRNSINSRQGSNQTPSKLYPFTDDDGSNPTLFLPPEIQSVGGAQLDGV